MRLVLPVIHQSEGGDSQYAILPQHLLVSGILLVIVGARDYWIKVRMRVGNQRNLVDEVVGVREWNIDRRVNVKFIILWLPLSILVLKCF